MQSLRERSPLSVYLDYLKDGQLAYQVASDGKPIFFPRVLAPGSGDTSLEWRVSKGVGTVYSTTVMYPRREAPYNVSLIDMDEGYRLMSCVAGIDPIEVRIGLRVSATVERDEIDIPYPVFHPASAGGSQ